MTEYKIAHISDLANIPPEHLDECLRDIEVAIMSIHITAAVVSSAVAEAPAFPGVGIQSFKTALPYVLAICG